MKVSEALRLGIGVVEDDKTLWLRTYPCIGGCAIGTILYAVGFCVQDIINKGVRACLDETWPWLKVPSGMQYKSQDIVSELSHRHYHDESRESLAAWLASIEPQDNSAAGESLKTEVYCETK